MKIIILSCVLSLSLAQYSPNFGTKSSQQFGSNPSLVRAPVKGQNTPVIVRNTPQFNTQVKGYNPPQNAQVRVQNVPLVATYQRPIGSLRTVEYQRTIVSSSPLLSSSVVNNGSPLIRAPLPVSQLSAPSKTRVVSSLPVVQQPSIVAQQPLLVQQAPATQQQQLTETSNLQRGSESLSFEQTPVVESQRIPQSPVTQQRDIVAQTPFEQGEERTQQQFEEQNQQFETTGTLEFTPQVYETSNTFQQPTYGQSTFGQTTKGQHTFGQTTQSQHTFGQPTHGHHPPAATQINRIHQVINQH